MKTLFVVATFVACLLLCGFQQAISSAQQKPGSGVASPSKQKADSGKVPHSAASPGQPATDAADKNAVAPTAPRQSDKVEVTALPPEIAVKQVKDSIDHTIMWCTIILTFVGSLGTWAALKTLRQVKRQADTLDDHKAKFDELAKAANSNAEAAILQVRAMQEQITEMSVQSGILQESVGVARNAAEVSKQNVALIINKERARIRIVKPEKSPILLIGNFVTVEFKLLFYGTTPAYEVKSAVSCTISESRDSFQSFHPHGIHELPTVVSASDIKPFYRDFLWKPLQLDEITLEKINKLEVFLHFAGIIKYDDFVEEPRETAFHYRWNAPDNSLNSLRRLAFPEGWEEVGGEKENYYT